MEIENQHSVTGTLVSVVIPCRNEAAYIEQCVNSVLDCDYPSDLLNVFVCDGMSEDGTLQIIENLANQNPQIQLLVNEQQTTPHALNLGIKASSADVILILGAHATISSDYISKTVAVLREGDNIGCVGGVLTNTYSGLVSEAISNAMSHPFGVGSAHFRTGLQSGEVDTVAFGAYTREVFENVGYFDEDLVRNQDDEFNYRIIKAGYKIRLEASITACYHVRGSFRKLFIQYFQYGYWKIYVNKKHGTVTSVRQVVPAMFVIGGISCIVLALALPQYRLFYTAFITSYAILAIASSFTRSLNPVTVMLTSIAFCTLHFSYGLGYIEGLVSIKLLGRNPSKAKSSR